MVALLQEGQARGNTDGAGDFAATFPSPVTPGSLIIGHASLNSSNTATAGTGLTAVRASLALCDGTNSANFLEYRVSQAADGQTWKVHSTAGGGVGAILKLTEWSGSWPSNPVLDSNTSCDGHAGPVHVSCALATAAGRSLLIYGGLLQDSDPTDPLAVDAGYTMITRWPINPAGTGIEIWGAYKVDPASSTAYTPGGTNNDTQAFGVSIVGAAFAEVAGGGFPGEPGGGVW